MKTSIEEDLFVLLHEIERRLRALAGHDSAHGAAGGEGTSTVVEGAGTVPVSVWG
jgi:hypothetical protein